MEDEANGMSEPAATNTCLCTCMHERALRMWALVLRRCNLSCPGGWDTAVLDALARSRRLVANRRWLEPVCQRCAVCCRAVPLRRQEGN